MKIFFYFFILFLVSGVVSAINYSVTTITDCAGPLTINVTGNFPIDPLEYEINDCVMNSSNLWQCACNGTVPVSINVQENTINKYKFKIDYLAYYYTSESSGGGRRSGGSGGYINRTITVINGNVTTNISNTNITIPTPTPTPNTPPNVTPIFNITPTPTPPKMPNITLNNSIPAEVPETIPKNIFSNVWNWIKKILFYKLW